MSHADTLGQVGSVSAGISVLLFNATIINFVTK